MRSSLSTLELYNKYKDFLYHNESSVPTFHGFDAQSDVVITGGGFLALHFIEQLQKTQIKYRKIVVIARSRDRFIKNAQYYKIKIKLDNIIFIEKNLNELRPQDLHKNISIVLHTAAKINLLKSIAYFEQDNIAATDQIGKICHLMQTPLALCSSLSVFASSNAWGSHVPNSLAITEKHVLQGGYAQSKAVGEMFVPKNTIIFRYGLLTASQETYMFPSDSFFAIYIKTLKHLNAIPSTCTSSFVDITPVNIAALQTINILEQIALNSRASQLVKNAQPTSTNTIFHIASQCSLENKRINEILDLPTIEELKFWSLVEEKLPQVPKTLIAWSFKRKECLEVFPEHLRNIDLFQSTNQKWNPYYPQTLFDEKLINCYITKITESPIL